MLLKKIPGEPQSEFYLSKCKYCGKTMIKTTNRQTLCSPYCKCKNTQDNKAKYQRKRRLLIKEGELISNECKKLGSSYLEQHPKKDFNHEYKCIKYELKRLGVTT